MSLREKLATVPFAHLLGIKAAAEDDKSEDDKSEDDKKAKAEDDKQKENESDDDYAKRMKAKADSEDTDGEDDKADDKEKATRAEERARCSKIIAAGINANCARQAGVFAFDTDMTADQAIAAMEASKLDTPKERLADKMAAVKIPAVGADGVSAPDTSTREGMAKAQADGIIAAMKRVKAT